MAKEYSKIVIERFNEIGQMPMLLGYMEHQIDLMAKVITDLTGIVDISKLPDEAKDRLEKLDMLLEHSSLNFENIDSPVEMAKFIGAVDVKDKTRKLQRDYLEALYKQK